MRVLVACEYSGTVRDAFAKLGHDAWSCDILPTDSPGQHYQCDIMEVMGKGWDLMIAHPPCTFLSNAGARFLYPNKVLNEDRLKQGMKAKTLFMVMLRGVNIAKVCIENPIPSTVFGLPKYDQIIQPYEYGHPVQKRTCLWLKGLPKLIPTNIVEERQSSKVPGNWFNKGGKDRQKARAKTFQGIADAMAQQWGSPCGS